MGLGFGLTNMPSRFNKFRLSQLHNISNLQLHNSNMYNSICNSFQTNRMYNTRMYNYTVAWNLLDIYKKPLHT